MLNYQRVSISFCMLTIDLSFPVGRSSLLAPMDGVSEEGFSKGESSQVGWHVSEVSTPMVVFHLKMSEKNQKNHEKPWTTRLQWSLGCIITSSNPDKSEFFLNDFPPFFSHEKSGTWGFPSQRQVAIPWRPWMRSMGFCQSYGLFGSVEQAGNGSQLCPVGIGRELELGSTLIRDYIYIVLYYI